MLITPVNALFGVNSNGLFTYDESEYSSNSTRMALIYSDSKSLFRIKNGSQKHYLEPYMFGVRPGAKFKIEFEGRKISGSPEIDIQIAFISSNMVVGGMNSGMYKISLTETYFKKYKIIVALPEGMNDLTASGVIFNIRTEGLNSIVDLRNLNIDVIDNPGVCIPKIKGVCYNNITKFNDMLRDAEHIDSNLKNVMRYANGTISGSGEGFKGVIQNIDNTIYANRIVISGEYTSNCELELKSSEENGAVVNLAASTDSFSKFTKVLAIPNRHTSTDLYVSIGTSTSNANVSFKDLKILDIANDDTFI